MQEEGEEEEERAKEGRRQEVDISHSLPPLQTSRKTTEKTKIETKAEETKGKEKERPQ